MIRAKVISYPQEYVPPVELVIYLRSPDEAAALFRGLHRDAEPATEDIRELLKSLLK